MFSKDGYRFVQGLIPTKIHKELVEASRRLGQSKSETIRNAIAGRYGFGQDLNGKWL